MYRQMSQSGIPDFSSPLKSIVYTIITHLKWFLTVASSNQCMATCVGQISPSGMFLVVRSSILLSDISQSTLPYQCVGRCHNQGFHICLPFEVHSVRPRVELYKTQVVSHSNFPKAVHGHLCRAAQLLWNVFGS